MELNLKNIEYLQNSLSAVAMLFKNGGKGSGHFDHDGRLGEIGGSTPSKSSGSGGGGAEQIKKERKVRDLIKSYLTTEAEMNKLIETQDSVDSEFKESYEPLIEKKQEVLNYAIKVLAETLGVTINEAIDQINKFTEGKQNSLLKNEKSLPEIFYCKHMLAGVVRYENEDVLVDVGGMKKLCNSFAGKPVYVEHQDVDIENLREKADGYVTECFYNELDGCLWAKFLAVSDEAKQKISEGWSVSNAYKPLAPFGNKGLHNNLPYDREILNGEFSHLAIVANPRYEKAKIYTPEEFKEYQSVKKAELDELKNSKSSAETNNQNEEKPMFKLFKNKKEEVSQIDAETLLEIKNDKGETQEISLQSMIDAVLNAKKNEKEEKKEMINEDTEVAVGDEKMSLKELINRYSNMCEKKNQAEEEDKKKKEEEEAKEKENKNSKHFDELKNAQDKAFSTPNESYETLADKIKRGSERYGKIN